MEESMKRTCVLWVIILGVFLTGGLYAGGRQGTTYLKFPTAATTGAVYTIGAALANEWTSKIPGLQISAEASNGGVQNLNLIAAKDAQVGVAVTSIVTQQKQGVEQFAGHQYDGIRILTALYSNYNQIVAASNSGINTFRDLKGKRFAPGAPGSTTTLETQVAFEAAGLNYPGDINAQFVGFDAAVDLMQNRQLDGAWIQAGIPTSAVSQICTTANGKLLSIDEDIIKKIQEKYSWYGRAVIPAGTYDTQSEDVVTTSLTITVVIDESVPEELVYNMAKVMWENIDTIKNAHSALKDAAVEGAVQNLGGLPLHPGAERYYRERGVLK
jgi:TRAP transporter TAXI family solute receptor